ncbi:hypothetical protein G9C85_07235 [Halorubellus sp. JP-L1]|uniref:hypothetical protein n=1 Tax=Halorubellus sp. JP-L1 TaxID=2715753 RepID=UPI00140CE848|nr:hypothetical protein [Halorubellus sp. JP-L1]NHN41430.1 hypothetical protein [Halorubellus sp. JP-L1]
MSEGSDASGGDEDSMRERAAVSSAKLWLLVAADRLVVAVVIAAFVFASMLAVDAVPGVDSVGFLRTGDPVETLFQAFVGAIITGVTLVVTLNQLVLSQELGAVGDQRERMEGALSFRRDAEEVLEPAVAPTEPSAFLRALVEASADRADALVAAVEDANASAAFDDAVSEYASSVTENANAVASDLEDAEFGTFDVLSAALDYDYSRKIYAARRFRVEYAEECTDDVEAAFDDLERALGLFAPAREHFKTLYFQWELVNLSRTILYAAVPALVTAASMIVFFESGASFVAGEALGVSTGVTLVAAASAVSVFPFALLVSYILRIATVTKRTLAIGPFVLRETNRSAEFEFEDAPE